jgi:hypothetical protein
MRRVESREKRGGKGRREWERPHRLCINGLRQLTMRIRSGGGSIWRDAEIWLCHPCPGRRMRRRRMIHQLYGRRTCARPDVDSFYQTQSYKLQRPRNHILETPSRERFQLECRSNRPATQSTGNGDSRLRHTGGGPEEQGWASRNEEALSRTKHCRGVSGPVLVCRDYSSNVSSSSGSRSPRTT